MMATGLEQQTQRGRRSSRILSPRQFAMNMARLEKKLKRFRADADQYLHYEHWENCQRYIDSQTRARKRGQSNP